VPATSVRNEKLGPGPLAWILSLFTLSLLGLAVGGFVLPKNTERRNLESQIVAAVVRPATDSLEVVSEEEPRPVEPTPTVAAVAPTKRKYDFANPTTPPQLPDGKAYDLAKTIDGQLNAALSKATITASPLATDAEYLRRAYLDLTGKVPSYERVKGFLADTDPQKRPKLIDELLASDDFGKHFAMIWADMLIKRDADTNRGLRTDTFVTWLAKQFNDNKGWDKIVTDMVTASGKIEDAPQTLFVLANQDNNQVSPAKLTAATANLFMGLQLQCAECHVHPTVETWKQDDFWGMAAFYGHVKFEREDGKVPKTPVVGVKEVGKQAEPKGKAAKQGEKAIPANDIIAIPDPTDAKKTTGTAKARLFEVSKPANLGTQIPYRPKLAEWLTSSKNAYFARSAVNRFWAHLFARGLINPVEDMGPNSKCSHPELLDALAKSFALNQFDVKFLLRAYCNTQAYNRTSKPNESNSEDETLLSHIPVKIIGARELLDSIQLVTAKPTSRDMLKFREKMATKGVAAPTSGVRFFDKREYEDEATEFSYGIPQLLKQMNTGMTNANGPVNRFAKSGRDRAEVINDLYLTALGRPALQTDLDRLDKFAEGRDPSKLYQDIFWALLNTAEFVSNH
jgi:Protein of unknown function (DUF1549)/Protein of unknown function (DUF1553)